MAVYAVKDGAQLDRPLRVAVVGGGPSGACTAETLAQGGIETYLIERKMDNCKVPAATQDRLSFPCRYLFVIRQAFDLLLFACSPAVEPSLCA